MSEEEEDKGKDLCPMCAGTGKHNLLPPDGKIYYFLFASHIANDVVKSHDDLQNNINKGALKGYEVQSQIPCGPNFSGTQIIMKWRWP